MISVIQLVTHGNVKVDNVIIGAIQKGIVALIGIEKTDTEKDVEKLFNKIIHYRIFPDSAGKTNLGLKDVQGGLLLVSQFTLVADTTKGLRPGFSKGMAPERGKELFEYLVAHACQNYPLVASGQYGANMQINLCNDGPMTFILRS
ncbi:MAG: D-aminoacyl-tRNA deacylase [Legionella sp.]|nr:D-aminoacyl-tRNA deacylase [Legionella sp.]